MTNEQIKKEQAKVDTMDFKEYAKDLSISEEEFKTLVKFSIYTMDKTLDELMSAGEYWYLSL